MTDEQLEKLRLEGVPHPGPGQCAKGCGYHGHGSIILETYPDHAYSQGPLTFSKLRCDECGNVFLGMVDFGPEFFDGDTIYEP